MAKSDGSVRINTLVDTQGFGKGMNTMQKQIGGLSGAIGKLGLAITAAFGIGKLIQFGKEAIELGSDLQEVQNVVDVTFRTMSDQVNEFARNAAEAAGLSETMAKRYMGTFGAMASSFGFMEEEAFSMSASLTQAVGDVASFYNLTQDEAYTKLKSVFTGETESLKDLGVVMTQSALDAYAMANGYEKTTSAMSEQEKVALRYSFVLDQLSASSGDFVRTSDSWANQMRILNLSLDTFKANIGQALINVFTPFLKIINQIVARMADLSASFVVFSQLITGRGASGGGSPGDALGEIAGGYDDVTDATNEAAKAQKNYTNGLDELNIMSSSNSETSGGSANVSNLESFVPEETNTELTESTTIFDSLIKKANELKEIFTSGFFDGFGDSFDKVENIKNAFDSIKESVSNIFSSDFFSSVGIIGESIIESFGRITGSVASIGMTIGENLTGGIAGFLESDGGRIQEYLLNMFSIGDSIYEKVSELWATFADVFSVVGDENGQAVTENLLGIFSNAFMGITELFWSFRDNLVTFIIDPIVNSKEQLKAGLNDLLGGLSAWTGTVKTYVSDLFHILNGIYENSIAPIFAKVMPELEKVWQEHIAPLISKIGEFFNILAENVGILWEDIFKPIVEWFADNVIPVIAPALEVMLKYFVNTFGFIGDVISNVLDILGGLIKFITGVFTGDWEKAWEGIVDIFSGIINTAIDIIENFVNNVINVINGLIDGVNSITSNVGIPEIPNIPELTIPHLARGAVIPPNAPFMAMLGDQRHGTNLEAPEDLIRQIVREEAGGNAEMMALLSEIAKNTRDTADKEMIIGDRDIAKANARGQRSMGYALIEG